MASIQPSESPAGAQNTRPGPAAAAPKAARSRGKAPAGSGFPEKEKAVKGEKPAPAGPGLQEVSLAPALSGKEGEGEKPAHAPLPVRLFNRWSFEGVSVQDRGLQRYLNISAVILPKSSGRFGHTQIHRNRMSIVERFITKLMVPGHRGRKHKVTSGRCPASSQAIALAVEEAFQLIEKKTGKNPIQALVRAVENAAVLEEIASYRLGGIIARQSVTVSPHRRLDLALRFLSQGIYQSGFGKKTHLPTAIAEELIAAAANDQKSFAVRERSRIEKEAEGAR